MTLGPGVRSFDSPRRRPAPPVLEGRDEDGAPFAHVVRTWTLVVAVKPQCDGCREFVHAPLDELAGVNVLVMSGAPDPSGEWRDAARSVIVAPDLLEALEIRFPPCYVLIDPEGPTIVAEGTVFAPSQVAAEIASYLT